MRKTLTLAVLCVAFGFVLGRSSARRGPASEPELAAGAELVVSFPVAGVTPHVTREPRTVYANQRLRVYRHDTPGAEQWRETSWRVRIGGREHVAAPVE